MFPEYEIAHSECYLDAKPIDARHTVDPTRLDETLGMVCAVCLKTVEWTGTSPHDPGDPQRQGHPGPWVHGERDSRRSTELTRMSPLP